MHIDEQLVKLCEAVVSGKATETPEFKRWFGNSKLVDKDGKPLMLYHGTNREPEYGNGDFSYLRTNNSYTYGLGIYLTPEAERASKYSKDQEFSRVFPVYASIQYPFVTPSDAGVSDIGIKLERNSPEEYEKMAAMARKLLDFNPKTSVSPVEVGNMVLRMRGHDGIIKRWPDGTLVEVVAFRPEQVKSAIGNNGSYNPDNLDLDENIVW